MSESYTVCPRCSYVYQRFGLVAHECRNDWLARIPEHGEFEIIVKARTPEEAAMVAVSEAAMDAGDVFVEVGSPRSSPDGVWTPGWRFTITKTVEESYEAKEHTDER